MKFNKKKRNGKIKSCDFVSSDGSNNLSFSRADWQKSKTRQFAWSDGESYPTRFKIELYRFLRDNIPLLNACVWTWGRLCSAPGKFEIMEDKSSKNYDRALACLEEMSLRIYPFGFQKMAGLESFFPLLFSSLFTDGAFTGYLVLNSDMSGIEKFQPVDPSNISPAITKKGESHLVLQTENGDIKIEGDDFYYLGLNIDQKNGLGRSILGSVPFVAYIEQQLIDDMRRTSHNAGYHRLHVQITPPEKMSGESDNSYVERVNEYFDDTVSMIRQCNPEDNPVTWDNVKVEYIGPRNVQGVTNSWFLNHRTMVEEICAGTNLAPFMLGYSYGTTHNWAQFKYDLVMRQVLSVQRQTARFLEWMGNIELALKGFNVTCRYTFDNTLSYMAAERADIEKGRVDSVIKLYSAGLISKEEASSKAGDLI